MAAFAVNPVESVLFLILTFCAAGGFLFLLKVEFLGLLYIVVYVGAVAVLFLFIIMMLNVKVRENIFEKIILRKYDLFVFISIMIIPLMHLIFVFLNDSFFISRRTNSLIIVDSMANILVFGESLFNYYILPFLIAGIILLVALIGCVIMTLELHKSNNV